MPKELEERLKRQAAKKGFKGARADRYVYGTIHKIDPSWKPKRKK